MTEYKEISFRAEMIAKSHSLTSGRPARVTSIEPEYHLFSYRILDVSTGLGCSGLFEKQCRTW